ncbi:hypothetical protein TARUN_10437, partial [Trichoderma arundinaceum]
LPLHLWPADPLKSFSDLRRRPPGLLRAATAESRRRLDSPQSKAKQRHHRSAACAPSSELLRACPQQQPPSLAAWPAPAQSYKRLRASYTAALKAAARIQVSRFALIRSSTQLNPGRSASSSQQTLRSTEQYHCIIRPAAPSATPTTSSRTCPFPLAFVLASPLQAAAQLGPNGTAKLSLVSTSSRRLALQPSNLSLPPTRVLLPAQLIPLGLSIRRPHPSQ